MSARVDPLAIDAGVVNVALVVLAVASVLLVADMLGWLEPAVLAVRPRVGRHRRSVLLTAPQTPRIRPPAPAAIVHNPATCWLCEASRAEEAARDAASEPGIVRPYVVVEHASHDPEWADILVGGGLVAQCCTADGCGAVVTAESGTHDEPIEYARPYVITPSQECQDHVADGSCCPAGADLAGVEWGVPA